MIQSPPTPSQDVVLKSQQTYGSFLYALQQWSSFNCAEIGSALATGTPPPLLNPPGPAPAETDLQLHPITQLATTHLKYARVALWPANSTADKFEQPLTPEGARDFREDRSSHATKQRDYDTTLLRLRRDDNTVCIHILAHVDPSCTARLHQHPDWATWTTPNLTTYARSHTLLKMITDQFEKGDNTMLSYQFNLVVSARQGPDNPNTTAFPEYSRQLDSVISALLDPTIPGRNHINAAHLSTLLFLSYIHKEGSNRRAIALLLQTHPDLRTLDRDTILRQLYACEAQDDSLFGKSLPPSEQAAAFGAILPTSGSRAPPKPHYDNTTPAISRKGKPRKDHCPSCLARTTTPDCPTGKYHYHGINPITGLPNLCRGGKRDPSFIPSGTPSAFGASLSSPSLTGLPPSLTPTAAAIQHLQGLGLEVSYPQVYHTPTPDADTISLLSTPTQP